ncbi:hypothetical protein CKAN_02092900 [Cinnamomum micranthum f. kanehirae]|uniref:Uncharacterized protein n=1 Tax=Cinnamomum micranthum f. kanehirae TaxID=337451 RepID=A0A443PLT8_9MAGN|nr:hypothetical protein CKAN_02092900 [Cinnamomum micranthum f. kanehirae]
MLDHHQIACIQLSEIRGIDYAVTRNEVPPTASDLPSLIKQGLKLATLSHPDSIIEVLLNMHAFGIPIERFVPTEDDESVAVFNTTAGDKPSNKKEQPCKLMTWSQEVVPIGRAHIGNGTQRIHCKALPKHAYKVTVDVIKKEMLHCPIQTILSFADNTCMLLPSKLKYMDSLIIHVTVFVKRHKVTAANSFSTCYRFAEMRLQESGIFNNEICFCCAGN